MSHPRASTDEEPTEDPKNADLITVGVMKLERFMEIVHAIEHVCDTSTNKFLFANLFRQFSELSSRLGKIISHFNFHCCYGIMPGS